MNCHRIGCTATAEGVPVLMVPAQGIPIPEHDPIQVMYPIPLCREHLQQVKIPPLAGSELGERLVQFCQQKGTYPPDFERVFVKPLELTSEDWRRFTEQGGAGAQGGAPGVTEGGAP